MNSAAETLPSLERLMRDVLRTLCEQQDGERWIDDLSSTVRKALQGTFAVASKQRPNDPPADLWDAAGFREIRALVSSNWADLAASLAPVWASREEAGVDLDRLLAYRGRDLHQVGPINFHDQQQVLSAMATRLRLGFEAVRRSTLDEESDWMVYLERIECPVEGLGWQRGGGYVAEPTVREDDLLTFRLVGVNPAGPQDTLVYSMEVTGIAAGALHPAEIAHGEFQFEVPRTKQIIVSGYVRDPDDPDMYDGQAVVARVIPRRPDRVGE